MKRTIIIAALAALALAGCTENSKDEADQNEISEETQYYIEWLSGTFHGEYSATVEYNITYSEDITFTPFEEPREATGAVDKTVYGEASICSCSVSDHPEYATDTVTFNCYYTVEYYVPEQSGGIVYADDFPLRIYYYQYDTETGVITDSGKKCTGDVVDGNSFNLDSFYWEKLRFSYTRQ